MSRPTCRRIGGQTQRAGRIRRVGSVRRALQGFERRAASGYRRYVRVQGGGLMFWSASGRLASRVLDTPLERLLPVTAAAATEEAEKTVLPMALVIDRSQSMEEDKRLGLAKEAAKQSVRVLEAYDKAGVVVFSDDAEWIAHLAPVADKGRPAQTHRHADTLWPDQHVPRRCSGRAGARTDRCGPAAYDPADRWRSRAGRLPRDRPPWSRAASRCPLS